MDDLEEAADVEAEHREKVLAASGQRKVAPAALESHSGSGHASGANGAVGWAATPESRLGAGRPLENVAVDLHERLSFTPEGVPTGRVVTQAKFGFS